MKRYCDQLDNRWTGRHQAAMAAVGDLQGKRILDLGCGRGWFEAEAHRRGENLTVGLDRRWKYLRTARKYHPGIFLQATLPQLPFREESFDLAVMWEVLEHLPAREVTASLQAIARVLKPQGRLVLSTPRFDLRTTLIDPAWYFGHRHYRRSTLINTLDRGGFQVERIWSAGGPFEVIAMVLFHPCRWILRREIPAKEFFERKRRQEYQRSRGWCTYFVEAVKASGGGGRGAGGSDPQSHQ